MTKKILILGGNGYIGSRLLYDLQSKYEITSVDNCWFNNPLDKTIIRDYKSLTSDELAVFDAIILLAGHSSVKMCDGPIVASWANNVTNFNSLVKKIDKKQLLIYASSGSLYGLHTNENKEDSDLDFLPINNYDLTKYTLDNYAIRLIENGYNIVGLRFGTVNGWSPYIRDDLMINSMVKKSLLENYININNLHINRPILSLSDLVYVIDTIISNPKSGIFNIASFTSTVNNIGISVSEKIKSRLVILDDTKNVYNFDMDTTKFKTTYNFKFTQTINDIIQELVNNFDFKSYTNRNKFISYE